MRSFDDDHILGGLSLFLIDGLGGILTLGHGYFGGNFFSYMYILDIGAYLSYCWVILEMIYTGA